MLNTFSIDIIWFLHFRTMLPNFLYLNFVCFILYFLFFISFLFYNYLQAGGGGRLGACFILLFSCVSIFPFKWDGKLNEFMKTTPLYLQGVPRNISVARRCSGNVLYSGFHVVSKHIVILAWRVTYKITLIVPFKK